MPITRPADWEVWKQSNELYIDVAGRVMELLDLPRVGESKADKIQECCDRYWEIHPRT